MGVDTGNTMWSDVGMATNTIPVLVRDLQPGDVVVSLETTTFTEPLTITRRNDWMIYNSNGGFWPIPQLGHHTAMTVEPQ